MTASDVAFPVRPGEHACCRFASSEDRDRLAIALVLDGLDRGHKVLYVGDSKGAADLVSKLFALDEGVESAVESGQIELRSALDFYAPDGAFVAERSLGTARQEHARALDEGYTGLSATGDMSWALAGAPGSDDLVDYERGLDDEEPDDTRVLLCQYDHGRFAPATESDVVTAHGVDVSPELAMIGRDGVLAAALVTTTGTLRLSGELDFGCAEALGDALAEHAREPLRLDLADLRYVDVAGMRALRGDPGRRLSITAASDLVRRLIELLTWDTDPDVEIVGAR
jgi:anti-anti-sigma regulatory factor